MVVFWSFGQDPCASIRTEHVCCLGLRWHIPRLATAVMLVFQAEHNILMHPFHMLANGPRFFGLEVLDT